MTSAPALRPDRLVAFPGAEVICVRPCISHQWLFIQNKHGGGGIKPTSPPMDRWSAAGGGVQITGGTCGAACGACGHANDTFLLQLPEGGPKWSTTRATGKGPPPRDRHCTVALTDTKVLDWGGYVDSHTVPPAWPTGVFQLSLETAAWTDISAKPLKTDEDAIGEGTPPPPRQAAVRSRPRHSGPHWGPATVSRPKECPRIHYTEYLLGPR
jgi:hypothetical protein